MPLRNETIDKLAHAIMGAVVDEAIESEADVRRIIKRATMTDKQIKSLQSKADKARAKADELEALTKSL